MMTQMAVCEVFPRIGATVCEFNRSTALSRSLALTDTATRWRHGIDIDDCACAAHAMLRCGRRSLYGRPNNA